MKMLHITGSSESQFIVPKQRTLACRGWGGGGGGSLKSSPVYSFKCSGCEKNFVAFVLFSHTVASLQTQTFEPRALRHGNLVGSANELFVFTAD